MKQLFGLLFSLFLFFNSHSQQIKKNEFVGTLQLSDNTIITFKLNYTELADGKIEGTSLSDIYGADRTLSKITGTYNAASNKISFKETGNVSTKSASDLGLFCFINVANAKIKTTGDKTIIQGTFTGNFLSGKKCASGNIYLISSSYVEKLSDRFLTKKYIKNEDSLAIIKEKVNELKLQTNTSQLRHNELMKLNWTSNEIIIEVWDGQNEDNDEISIYINDKKVLDQFIIKKEKKQIIVPINQPINNIKIVAISEGIKAPCTANVGFVDGVSSTPIVAILKKGESTNIQIIKK